MTLGRALAEVVSKAGIPYGTPSRSGPPGHSASQVRFPGPAEVFLFVGGGTVAYGGLAFLVSRRRLVRAARPPAALCENVFAVPAIAVTYVLDRVVPAPAANFFLSPLAGILVYLLGLAVVVSWVTLSEEAREATHSHDPGPSGRDEACMRREVADARARPQDLVSLALSRTSTAPFGSVRRRIKAEMLR